MRDVFWRWRFNLAMYVFKLAVMIAPPDFTSVVQRVWECETREGNILFGELKEKLGVTDG